jgi:kumamolisin
MIMKTSKSGLLILLIVLGIPPTIKAQTLRHEALPYPTAHTPRAIDRGALTAGEGTTPISVTIVLALPKLSEAEKLQQSLYTPGDPQYHQFLTADQFVTRFGPTSADIAKVIAGLTKYGLTVEQTTATTLKATGMPADMERAFSVSLHSFEVPAYDDVAGYRFHAPQNRATIPAEISAAVRAVVGLDNRPVMRPLYESTSLAMRTPPSGVPSTTTGNPFGYLTVTDFADYYDVDPLYQKGLTGDGRTMGILTFAAFKPSDVFAYWQAVGLKVNPNRIQVVNVDGGPGAPSDASGSLETTLDVEQSGGIAPGANIIVYQAPNFFANLVDVFAQATEDNKAESLGISWGVWEWLTNLENYPVIDPVTGQMVGASQAIHELLLRAAIQGQSVFAGSGDGGAYTANDNFGCFGPYSPSVANSCSLTLSVISPGGDSLITSAGGTTLPGLQEFCENTACTPPYYEIHIPHERVWGWDYLIGFCKQVLGLDPIACGIFPLGTGGGVSVTFFKPSYQFGIFGTQLSQPGQAFYLQPYGLLDVLPPFYPGRNLPDVSFNADPDTGYVIYYTSSATGFALFPGYGGTSFVDQQLNGVTALLEQDLETRVGFLNPALYGLAETGQAYSGPRAPLHAIAYGDNWFYHGSNGYNPGAGLGTLDVANFAGFLRYQH